jgi:hypothetical protein
MTEFSAWKWMETGGAPTRGRAPGLPPLRRLRPMPPMIKEVHVPSWDWKSPAYDRNAKTILVDRNAAYVSAASSVRVAHGALDNTGPIPFDNKRVGYWCVDFAGTDEEGMRDRWAYRDDLMSPLGTGRNRLRCWLAHPTANLLDELAEDGKFAPLRIVDSWTSTEGVALSKWSTGVQNHRLGLMDAGTEEELEQFKKDYSKVVQMLLTGEGFAYRRGDWHHAIVAQFAATSWRTLWNCHKAGHGPVAAGSRDAAAFLPEDYDALTMCEPSPLKIDNTGRALGTWKIDN